MSKRERAFREAVLLHVNRCLPGFSIEETSRLSFRVVSEWLSVHIGCNWTNVVYVECSLEPSPAILASLPQTKHALVKPVALHNVLECLAPDVPESQSYPRPMMFGLTIHKEVERQLALIGMYCADIVAGNVGSWRKLCDCLEDQSLTPKDDELDVDYASRLRRLADAGWHLKRYRKVESAYMRLLLSGGELTLRDRWRLWYSRKHTFMVK